MELCPRHTHPQAGANELVNSECFMNSWIIELGGPLSINCDFHKYNYFKTNDRVRHRVNRQFPFPEIWISISLLVQWSDQCPNWPRRWISDNRDMLDYDLDKKEI